MSKSHSIIEPFPAHIDRRDFANWLSGFVDGEGCFVSGELLSQVLQWEKSTNRLHQPSILFPDFRPT